LPTAASGGFLLREQPARWWTKLGFDVLACLRPPFPRRLTRGPRRQHCGCTGHIIFRALWSFCRPKYRKESCDFSKAPSLTPGEADLGLRCKGSLQCSSPQWP